MKKQIDPKDRNATSAIQGLPKFGIFGNFGKKNLPRMLNRGYFYLAFLAFIILTDICFFCYNK